MRLTNGEEQVAGGNLVALGDSEGDDAVARSGHDVLHLHGFENHDFLALLAEKYALKGLVIGYDHRFGHNRSDGINEYKAYGQEFGIEVIQASPFLIEGYTVSSSAIREALMQREVAKANLMLGYRFPLSGCVVGGQHIGRSLGFPTANIQFAGHNKLLPPVGVYAVTATLPDGTPDRPNNLTAQYGMSIERKFDYGITGGAGIELNTRIGHFMLEGRYYYGLSDIFDNSKTDVFARSNNGTIVVKLTYLVDILSD